MKREPRTTRVAVYLTLSLAAIGCGDSTAPQATDPIDEETLLRHLNFLARDSLYGRGAGSPQELLAALYLRDEFIAYGLAPGVPGYLQAFDLPQSQLDARSTPVSSDVESKRHTSVRQDDDLQSHNVIGSLAGHGAQAGQWIVVGAHYDHLGWRRVNEDSIIIYNGADDNASGTSLLLEIARYLSHYLTSGADGTMDHRSVMFHGYGAEELGLLGSRYYVDHLTVPSDSIVAMINLDMVGRLRANTLVVGGVTTAELWDALLTRSNAAGLLMQYSDAVLGSSDQYPFYLLQKPVLMFHTGLHAEYHQPDDDVWLINLDGMVEVGNLALAILLEVATLDEPPLWEVPTNP
jgi:hypothetical protein